MLKHGLEAASVAGHAPPLEAMPLKSDAARVARQVGFARGLSEKLLTDENPSTTWWTNQNCVEDFASLRRVLPGPIKWLEQHAPLRPEVEQGKVVHRDRNVVCVWLPPKPPPLVAASLP